MAEESKAYSFGVAAAKRGVLKFSDDEKFMHLFAEMGERSLKKEAVQEWKDGRRAALTEAEAKTKKKTAKKKKKKISKKKSKK